MDPPQRHQLGTNLTPITEASFAKWKADRKEREATEKAEADKQKAEAYKQFKAGVKSGMAFSGRELFDFNPDWAAGDADEDIADTNMREEDVERAADEEVWLHIIDVLRYVFFFLRNCRIG